MVSLSMGLPQEWGFSPGAVLLTRWFLLTSCHTQGKTNTRPVCGTSLCVREDTFLHTTPRNQSFHRVFLSFDDKFKNSRSWHLLVDHPV